MGVIRPFIFIGDNQVILKAIGVSKKEIERINNLNVSFDEKLEIVKELQTRKRN